MHHAGNEYMLGRDVRFHREGRSLVDAARMVDPLELPKLILNTSPWHTFL